MIGRKYAKIVFTLDGTSYEYIIPFDRKNAMNFHSYIGGTSGKNYSFHPGLLPKINAALVGETVFVVDGDQRVERIEN
jgi:hypothetical protein